MFTFSPLLHVVLNLAIARLSNHYWFLVFIVSLKPLCDLICNIRLQVATSPILFFGGVWFPLFILKVHTTPVTVNYVLVVVHIPFPCSWSLPVCQFITSLSHQLTSLPTTSSVMTQCIGQVVTDSDSVVTTTLGWSYCLFCLFWCLQPDVHHLDFQFALMLVIYIKKKNFVSFLWILSFVRSLYV